MRLTLASILNPLSGEAKDRKLDRRAFLSELVLATLCSLVLPLLTLIGMVLSDRLSAEHARFAVLSLALASLFLAFPLMFYAGLRLNAAALARERALTRSC